MLEGLEKGDVLLADRGFCSYGLIGVMLARGVDCVMRLHQRRSHDVAQGRRLGPGDQLVEWPRPRDPRRNDPWAAERPTLPASLTVRLVSFRVEVPGLRTEQITLATTLPDAEAYPPEALAALCRARWNIELRYAERVARSAFLYTAERIPRRRRSGKSKPRWVPTCSAAKALR